VSSFAEMSFKFGQALQLQLAHIDQSRFYCRLVGYLVDHAVIVTTPTTRTGPFEILPGDKFIGRAFAGRRALAFSTDVLSIAHVPFPHLFLRYPREVQAVVVRKATRVAMQRAITLAKGADASWPATLSDLSLSGAGVEAAASVAAVAETLELVLPASADGQPETRLKAVVRGVRTVDAGPAAETRSHYGLEFVDIGAEHSQLVQNLIQEQILNEG